MTPPPKNTTSAPKNAPKSPKHPRRGGLFPKSLSDALRFSTQAAMKKRGFLQEDLLRHWSDIVGAELSRYCSPVKLTHAGQGVKEGTLYIRAHGGFALQLQLQQPLILERLSLFCGYRIAGRVVILR